MIKILGLLALVVCFCASAEITVTRDGSTDWICADADGVPLSNHTRIDKAFEACTNRTLLDGLVYRVVAGSTYAIQSDGVVIPPEPVDSDGDGVNDDVDQCPGTIQGVEVDADGCEVVVVPPDADGDGIPDADDECPNDATNTCNDPPIGSEPPLVAAANFDQCLIKLNNGAEWCEVQIDVSPLLPTRDEAGNAYGVSGAQNAWVGWNGGYFDQTNRRWLIFGGGHSGSGINAVWGADLVSGQPLVAFEYTQLDSLLFNSALNKYCWINSVGPPATHMYDGVHKDIDSPLVLYMISSVMYDGSCSVDPATIDPSDPRIKTNVLGWWAFNPTHLDIDVNDDQQVADNTFHGVAPGEFRQVGSDPTTYPATFSHNGKIWLGGYQNYYQAYEYSWDSNDQFVKTGNKVNWAEWSAVATGNDLYSYFSSGTIYHHTINPNVLVNTITNAGPHSLSGVVTGNKILSWNGTNQLVVLDTTDDSTCIIDYGSDGPQEGDTGKVYSKFEKLDGYENLYTGWSKHTTGPWLLRLDSSRPCIPIGSQTAQSQFDESGSVSPGYYSGGLEIK